MVDFSLKKARNNWKNHMKTTNGSGVKDSNSTASIVSSPSKGSKKSNSLSPNIKARDTNKMMKNSKTVQKDALNLSTPYTKLPEVNAHEKNKAASSMHRRLSMYSSKHIAPIALQQQQYSIPLPPLPINNSSQLSFDQPDQMVIDHNNKDREGINGTLNENYLREVIKTKNLRLILSDENFNAKEFIHNNLSNVSATDIDQFTSALNELSESIQIEVKDNINKSYKEILQVNRDLNLSTKELNQLRDNIQNLNEVMNKFVNIADRRINWEIQRNNERSISNNSNSNSTNDLKSTSMLLPPINSNGNNIFDVSNNNSNNNMTRDMNNINVVKKIWHEELINLEKEIEGATNFLVSKDRHLIIKSDDLFELNVTTLRYLQTVRLYIFNDLILVAGKNNSNNKNNYILKQVFDLKDYSISQDIRYNNRLIFKSHRPTNMVLSSTTTTTNNNAQLDDILDSHNSTVDEHEPSFDNMNNTSNVYDDIISMYESRNKNEVDKIIEAIRSAKDDLCDIFQNELQYEEKLRESFRHLQFTQQTPAKDANLSKSPIKNSRYSLNNNNNIITDNNINNKNNDVSRFYRISNNNNSMINYNDLIKDQQLLQSLTIAMRANMRDSRIGTSSSMSTSFVSPSYSSFTNQLLAYDNNIEEVDIMIARSKYSVAVATLINIKRQLVQLYPQLTEIETNFLELLMIKINLRLDSIYHKVVNKLTINSTTSATTSNNNNEISQLLNTVETMIELGKAEEGLELFLQNRSNLIQDLILQIGSFDNLTNYVIQLSIIRFQIIKQTVLNYRALFDSNNRNSDSTQNSYQYLNENGNGYSSANGEENKNKLKKELSSILVNWCDIEIDKHFQLINEQLLNNEMISPMSIKSSRKQIDELKTVGLDFVYKLDEFIRLNSQRIG